MAWFFILIRKRQQTDHQQTILPNKFSDLENSWSTTCLSQTQTNKNGTASMQLGSSPNTWTLLFTQIITPKMNLFSPEYT